MPAIAATAASAADALVAVAVAVLMVVMVVMVMAAVIAFVLDMTAVRVGVLFCSRVAACPAVVRRFFLCGFLQ